MADRSRDLEFRLLSNLDRLDTDTAARDLEQLGRRGKEAGDTLDRAMDDGRRAILHLVDDTDTARKSLDRYSRDTKDTARDVARAFDRISDSSRQTFRKDLDDDLDKAADGLDEFKDEAQQSGREAAASFSGGFDDVADLIQEVAANAFSGFGPLGLAAGIAAATGIGAITAAFGKSKEKAEEAKQAVSDWVQAYVDGLGTIQEETIQSKLNEFAEDGAKKLHEYSDQAKAAGVNVSDYLRALAGDIEAQERVAQQYREQSQRLAELSKDRTADAGALTRQGVALQDVAGKLGITNSQMREGKARADELRDALNRPISAKIAVGIDIPSPRELDEINRRVRAGIGTIVIPLEPGQNRFTNNANNSRYR